MEDKAAEGVVADSYGDRRQRSMPEKYPAMRLQGVFRGSHKERVSPMQGAEVLARIEGADFLKEMVDSAETGAMLLAMSNSVAIEDAVKTSLNKMGYRFAVTEVGGNTSYNEFREKVTKAIVGAGLNCGVIKKVRREVHALLHAAEEAKTGALVSVSSAVDVSFKIGIVRDENWIAVAFFGKSAFYYVTNHRRAGMGVMHISPVV